MRRRHIVGARGWIAACLAVLTLIASACGTDAEDDGTAGPATPGDDAGVATAPTDGDDAAGPAGDLVAPRIGLSASMQPSYIPAQAGPVMFGEEFGLTVTQDDFISFDSHSTVVQAALSGEVDVVGASTMAHLAIIAQGQPFKMFAPFNNSDDFVLAGRGDVTSIEQLMDPEVTVATDDLGGAGQTIFDAILQAEDAGFLVTDIPNTVVIGSSGGRESALASGEVDATVVHIYQAERVNDETGDVNIISTLYENVPVFQMQAYAAPQEWIDDNLETAAAFTASIIQASRMLQESFEDYQEAVESQLEEPPDEETLRAIFDIAQTYDLWADDGGLQEERIQFMVELGQAEGVFEEDLTYDQVVDTRPRDMALEMLDG